MQKEILMNGSAEGGILFNCFAAQSVEATNVRRKDVDLFLTVGAQKVVIKHLVKMNNSSFQSFISILATQSVHLFLQSLAKPI
jgi:hypothetical protein